MRPLDESLRMPAAAVTGRPAARQGSRDQVDTAPGAFEEAIADAGRPKAQGKGGDQSLPPARASGDRQPNVGTGNQMTTAANATAKDEMPLPDGTRAPGEGAAKRPQQAPSIAEVQVSSKGDQRSGERELGDPAASATRAWRGKMQADAGSAEEATTADMPDGDTGSDEPGSGTVADLLTMLGSGAAATTVATQQEGKAGPAAGDHARSLRSVTNAGGRAEDDEPLLQAEKPVDGGGADRLFRFARADGKGQAVSMSISQDGEKVTVDNVNSPGGSKAEAVSVLEARRYLGVAMTANAASVTGAIAADGEWAAALQSTAATAQPEAWSQAGKTLNTLKIQMHPIDLGTVTATLRLKDDELQVDLKVETGEAFRQLRDDQSEMVKALRAQGFAVDHVNIVFNAGGDGASANGSQQQAQTPFGNDGRGPAGNEGGERRQRQEGGQAATERWAGNDGMDDAATGAERGRAGDVYM